MTIYTEKDLPANLMRDSTVAVLGYGNQGHAHALNLRDSGAHVVVGTRPGGSARERAEADGFTTVGIGEAVGAADVAAVLLPDESQPDVFTGEILPNLRTGAALVFAHGFSVAFGCINPPAESDVVLVAPKAQGHRVRSAFNEGTGVPCLLGVHQDSSGRAIERALSYAALLGCLRAGAILTTFRDEAVTDLFGEQAVLCGGVPGLVKAAFETLVERGYPPEVAYIECLHELKIITDLMVEGGIAYMRRRISRTAAWGSCLAEGRVVSKELKSTLGAVLDDIESGAFADRWREEASSGAAGLRECLERESEHAIECAGRSARAIMGRPMKEDS
jgi:ketol-acid reductoisomerase